MIKNYEMVIGLEVHVELATKTKIFCGCSTAFGALPNTQCCPICTGMPGTLPVLNKTVVEYAIKAGLATNCEIARFSKQDRKNYFYPDLPKAYQISQYDLPLCSRGWLDIQTESSEKRVGITRIHIEEDAGKLVHSDDGGTFCDYNRCGVPLIEIVSEPDIRSAEEAKNYLKKLRAIMVYIGVSDCKMQEGSLRCDVNLSVRKIGEEKFGTRTEMKNLNSFQHIGKAIEYEYARQVKAIESGEDIVQETRRYDENTGKTFSMRKKEDANDYRYFPDPDLVPITTSDEKLADIRASIPMLPDERKRIYIENYDLTPYDAEQLVSEKHVADYFETAAKLTTSPKTLANLIIAEIFRMMDSDEDVIRISPQNLAKTAQLSADDKINSSVTKKLVAELWQRDRDPEEIIEENGWWQINDRDELTKLAQSIIDANPKAVADVRSGKAKALMTLMGLCMRDSGNRANPVLIKALLEELVSQ